MPNRLQANRTQEVAGSSPASSIASLRAGAWPSGRRVCVDRVRPLLLGSLSESLGLAVVGKHRCHELPIFLLRHRNLEFIGDALEFLNERSDLVQADPVVL